MPVDSEDKRGHVDPDHLPERVLFLSKLGRDAPTVVAIALIPSRLFRADGRSDSVCPQREIYGENEPADYLYKVISGTVRTYKVLNDGRRQIGAFYLPGDMFGLENGAEHAFSAEAIATPSCGDQTRAIDGAGGAQQSWRGSFLS